ncbi:MAG: HD domain-containing protein [Humidesulfovibrio sp.]|nr:HD domain-containing protein [Humidesulfovibrio sp.]
MSRLDSRSRLTRLADFLFECGMLRKTPRTGYQFLGTGQENVAEHSFRTAVIGFVLAQMAGANMERTALMCLFHDLHEARTGDFNYVNRIYNTSVRTQALADALSGTGLGGAVMPLWEELEKTATQEAQLAQDADQLDLMLNLKEESDLGNRYADKWLDAAKERLRTPEGRELGRVIMETDHTDWWFLGPDQAWWERKNGSRKELPKIDVSDSSVADTENEDGQ